MNPLHICVEDAVRSIPPVWPLASSVAVNPYLGQSEKSLAQTGALLARVSGQKVTMSRAWYAGKFSSGEMTEADLEAALDSAQGSHEQISLAALRGALKADPKSLPRLPTVADLATDVSDVDWPALLADRFGAWAAGYFDEGQALWSAPLDRDAFAAWRNTAMHDLTPEIMGLKGFASYVADCPHDANAMIKLAGTCLGLTSSSATTYFHALLMDLGGWSQVARYKLWKAELAGETDTTTRDLLAVRLVWEVMLFERYGDAIKDRWAETLAAHAAPLEPTMELLIDSILQDASERAAQRKLEALLAGDGGDQPTSRPILQAAFCIDVRSEVFRRALESVGPGIQSLGFAGFFGLGTAHRSFASDVEELRLPVLLNPGVQSVSGSPMDGEEDQSRRIAERAKRAWGRFKLAAVSSFAFVEASGPVYAGKLLHDALGLKSIEAPSDPAPRLDPELDLGQQIEAANTVLRAMSLTDNFAELVVVAGHGANVTNNAHASALHCGACGGYSGEVNARLLAGLLNNESVREGLVTKGIIIPPDTLFVAGLHDTTTDTMTLYDNDYPSAMHADALRQAARWFEEAGKISRSERTSRLPRAESDNAIFARATDWAETRPEWALAGCQAFIAAPRHRTLGKGLQGRAFLHDYVWQRDEDFGVLELIMTAPVVVASWISLQYFGSCVSPDIFGGGNKLLHNVTGGLGVVEGNGGLLRPGLPWQSVHDGDTYAHDPLRLSVCIEAPQAAITDVLARHDGVRALFDNKWLHLFALDEGGHMRARYVGDLQWEDLVANPKRQPLPLAS